MRHKILFTLCSVAAIGLSGCTTNTDAEIDRALQDVNAIEESGLNHLMLEAADPEEAVSYFQRTLLQYPDRLDIRRGLAQSLTRASRPTDAVRAWQHVVEHPEATNEDRVFHADALIRDNQWEEAETVLAAIPPTHETYDRYRLEAMIADSNQDWERADSFYETAAGLTTQPAGVLNNWGYSLLTRGDFVEAEDMFRRALRYDGSNFTIKNNLVLARAVQRKYDLPVIRMTQIERAHLLHTMALAAIRQGDIIMGKTLLEDAINTHPQHFDAAIRALEALEA